ncbi:hypothetical protein V8G54_007168 [Vigna mungo]|uniref:Pentatricopeptide repeat-containing protein n=1 Tax=Vigna mungo TaxID=3915 RepID=A0AAQ3S8Q5_VIGMU
MASVSAPTLSYHNRSSWRWNHDKRSHFSSFTLPKSSLSLPTTRRVHDHSRAKINQPHHPFLQSLHNLCDSGNLNEALNLLHSQTQNAVVSSSDVIKEAIGLLLRACTLRKDIDVGRKLHAMVSESHRFRNDVVLNTRIISMFSACGSPSDSRSAFDAAKEKDLFLYNALLTCSDELLTLKELHGYALRRGLQIDELVANAFVAAYAKCKSKKFKAAIIRIDSPGGDALASDL